MIDYRIYPFVMFVHLLAATLLVASSLYAPLVRGRVRDASSARETRRWLDFAHQLDRVNPLAALAVLGTGLYLGSVVWWRTGWFAVSVVAFVANCVLAIAVVKQHEARLARALDATPPDQPAGDAAERLRHARRWELAGDAMIANDLTLLFLMVKKPSTEVAVGVLLAALVGAALVRQIWTRSGPARRPASAGA